MSSRSRPTTPAANAWRALRAVRLAIAAIGIAAPASPALAAPGDLDPTFGKGGRVIVDIENDNDSPAGILLQPDGKIVVGRSNTANTDDFSVLRFNPDGSPDTSFDSDGRSSLDIPGIKGTTKALLQQPDGKIVAVGETVASVAGAIPSISLVRYLANGSPDPTFGVGGVAIQSSDFRYESVAAVALQPDGRLLVAGNAYRVVENKARFAVRRFEPDGSLDRSFGEDGYAFGTGNRSEHGGRLSLQADGTLLVFGDVEAVAPKSWYDWSPAITRLHADGSPDLAFGDNGRASILSEASFAAVVTQYDGRLLLAAANHPAWEAYCGAVLTRVYPDGRRDDTFGIDGAKQISLGGCTTFGGALLIDAAGNVVADATKSTNDVVDAIVDSVDYVVTRLYSSGELDRSFGIDGQAVLDVGEGRSLPYVAGTGNLVRQDDGKLVIATAGIRALSWRGDDNQRMVLARLQASGGSPGLIGIKAVEPRYRASDESVPILVRRSGGSQGIVSVDYSTAGGAGSQGFVPVSGTLVWGDGDRADKPIVLEPPGGFTLSLTNVTGGAELAMSEIQIGNATQTTTNATPSSTASGLPPNTTVTPANSNAGGGGGAMSWQVLILMALAALRRSSSRRVLR